jgi:hypothetical protein
VRVSALAFMALVLAGPAFAQEDEGVIDPPDVFIEDLQTEMTESTKSWDRHIWSATVRNARTTPVTCGLGVAWLDKDGNIVDVDAKVAELQPGQSGKYKGYALIHQPDAAKVEGFDAKLKCDDED